MDIKSCIRTIVDYPEPGVRFRDITPLLKNPSAFRLCVDRLYQRFQNTELDVIATLDARGFLFGSALAYLLGVPLIPIRKQGKLPGETVSLEYELEYGTSCIEVHADSIQQDERIILIDDLIATGGTAQAAIELLNRIGGRIVECAVVVELVELGGRSKISPVTLHSLVTFTEDEI
ncbi:MAG: adenine phosphoribosyltransferase [Acidiferrobacterales bacterium]|nr:adenine phosphoribosyltransferase [Acidiferrobacterales bacterium]